LKTTDILATMHTNTNKMAKCRCEDHWQCIGGIGSHDGQEFAWEESYCDFFGCKREWEWLWFWDVWVLRKERKKLSDNL